MVTKIFESDTYLYKHCRLTLSSANELRFLLLSDTHELHRKLNVPDGDILIHAGDFTMLSKRLRAISDFNAWLGELPHR